MISTDLFGVQYFLEEVPYEEKTVILPTELPEPYRESVYLEHYDVETDYEWWDFVYCNFIEDAHKEGFDVDKDKIWFGLHYPGEGACFEAGVDVDTFLDKNSDSDNDFLRQLCIDDFLEIWAKIKLNHSHNTHSSRMMVDMDYYVDFGYADDYEENEEHYSELEDRVEKLIYDLEEHVLEVARNLADELHIELSDTYEYLTSEECVLDSLKQRGVAYSIEDDSLVELEKVY